MIAMPQPEPTPEPAGGLGAVVSAEAGIRDTRLMRKAIEQRWPIKPEYREAVVNRLVRIVADKGASNREAVAAAKGLIAAESQNQVDENGVQPLVNINLGSGASVQQVMTDVDYLEFLRVRRLEGRGDAGVICGAGQPGAVEDGKASPDPRPGANGNGNGHH